MTGKRNNKRPNQPPQGVPWIWQSAELLTSPAWRSLSINARRALDRIMLEHMAHAGTENGNLIVTHAQFVKHGVSANCVGDALDELEFKRLISFHRGRGGRGGGFPNKFGLSWLPQAGSYFCDDLWKRVTEERVAHWTSNEREKARCRRSRSMPKTARQGFKNQKPTQGSTIAHSPHGECKGVKKPNFACENTQCPVTVQ